MTEVTEYVATYNEVPDNLAAFIADLQSHYSNIPEQYRENACISIVEEGDYDVFYEREKTKEELEEDEERADRTRIIRIRSALNVLKELNYEGGLNGN